ncbi:unnamed protein product [Bursaphelenchus okinawaensis]|uniref:SUI1 domain-containing protein n=1 Tax=Bursaphelenchus okinawaensis TaxID=465554 RepID=A0A811K5N3_9BILA|nr:unnamed protein product [Bursaphelenchus okinawaensis]CAG9093116.1 unnamed protein product [Bursaphelenchus okinawaensis]
MPSAYDLLHKLDQSWRDRFPIKEQPSVVMQMQPLGLVHNELCSAKPQTSFYLNHFVDGHPDDFGHVIRIGAENLNDQQRYHYLNNYFRPPKPPLHEWPSETRMLNGKRIVRRLNPSYDERADCSSMVYSPMYEGLFCRYCALFPPKKPHGSYAAFIKRPFVRFSHMFGNGGAVKKHISRKYHLEAEQLAESFMQTYKPQIISLSHCMFKKPYTVKSNTNVRNSDRKKLFSTFTPESVEKIPSKATFSISKVSNFQQRDISVYFCEKTPLFFKVEDDNCLYPTLYFTWKCPKAVPMLLIHRQVFEFVQNGADLMLPGVHVNPDYKLPEFPADSPVTIGIYSPNGTVTGPVAVGVSLMSSQVMLASGMKGRGVAVYHVIHDHLWEAGPKGNPPTLQLESLYTPVNNNAELAEEALKSLTFDEDAVENAEDKALVDETKDSSAEAKDTSSGSLDDTVEHHDETLKKYFFWTLKNNVDASALPVDAGQFYATYLLKKLPDGVTINLKKTSFKKFSTFLKKINEVSDDEIVKVTTKKGIDSIVEINFSHPLIQTAEQLQSASVETEAATVGKPKISECFSVTEAVMPFLGQFGFRKGDIIQQNQVREAVVSYGNKHNLVKNKNIELDDQLQTLMRNFLPATVPLNDVVQKLVGQMTKTIMVTLEDGRKNIKRNQVPNIEFKIEKRSGNKTVTLVNNFLFFGIDPKVFSKKIQNAMATGASINQDVPNCEGPQLLVHGNHVNYIGELLQNEFGINKKYIKGLELGLKQKKGKK